MSANSGIIKRTAFYEVTKKNGNTFHRFCDFAAVTTGIGPMVEPFNLNQRLSISNNFTVIDYEDDMARVDELARVQSTDLMNVLSDDVQVLHGGYTLPRSGR